MGQGLNGSLYFMHILHPRLQIHSASSQSPLRQILHLSLFHLKCPMQSLKVIYESIANKNIFSIFAVQLCDGILYFFYIFPVFNGFLLH